MYDLFNGNLLRDAIISGANNISNQRQRIDELNVFPVPDGDTGTNMSMTMNNAVRELSGLNGQTAAAVASANASALLNGARGNSGSILSLLFRGFLKGLAGKEYVDAEGLKNSMKLGVECAYKAVKKPTEGTILTVARVAYEYADAAYNLGKDEMGVFEAILEGAREALASTPELLPVLKKAGVVDAGGAGFVVVLEGMYSVFKDGKIIELQNADDQPAYEMSYNAAAELDEEITFTYCTEYIVKRSGNSEPKLLSAYLETIGDCVVVVDDDDIIKVHVHTDHPGNAIEKGITYGQLVNLKIENMRDQHERAKHNSEIGKKKAQIKQDAPIESVEPEKDFGFVSVCAGAGLEGLFKDLGADNIVSGGQTMNPSTNDILRAIEATPARTVFVLPNNKNIIMTAEQAISLSSRNVIVLPTRTIPQGISAMLAFDPDSSADDNAINMQAAYSKVQTGQVTFAARDSNFDGKDIKAGDILALANGKIAFTSKELKSAVTRLTKSLASKSSAFVTLIYGEEVDETTAEEIKAAVSAKLGADVEVSLINGGQPVYYFIISVE